MSDTEAAGEDIKKDVKPHHTINQELDIGTPKYQK